MSQLPDNIRGALRDLLHGEPKIISAVSGGMINQTAQVEVNGKRCFVKWNHNAPPAFFEVEVRGLELLRAAKAFRVPEVMAHSEASPNAPAYLILEWIDSSAPVEQWTFAANFGRALAALHHVSHATFGLDHDNYIGHLPQSNSPNVSWATFFREQRIAVQVDIARKLGHLPPKREALLQRLMERIEKILEGAPSVPSLLHGDFWAGNFLVAAGNQLVLFDPAVYYGDREAEIAYTEMFGGFPAGFRAAYHEAYPLDAGYEYRRPLLQLYPMLVHLNHFGEQYGSGVEALCQHYL